MRKNFKVALVILGPCLASFLFWNTSAEPRARDNPDLDYKGSITLEPLDKCLGSFFSYGFMKSTWLSGFDVSVHIRPQIVDDQQLLDLLLSVLNECSIKIGPTAYASETYLSPKNPCLYFVMIHDKTPLSDEERDNTLIFENGVARRIKGITLCNDEEKKLLAGRKKGVVWRKSIEEILASSSIDHSALQADPELVFNFTDDEERRSIALEEVARINSYFEKKGYDILEQRMLRTGLKNKGALREWFFEYKRYHEKDAAPGSQYGFDPEPHKREWLEIARELLKQLNESSSLVPYRDRPWDLKSLRFNLSISKDEAQQIAYVTWSHFVIDYMRFNKNGVGIIERKLVKIPLEEFYDWAEAELEKLKDTNIAEPSSHL